jgi:hypothetical protein
MTLTNYSIIVVKPEKMLMIAPLSVTIRIPFTGSLRGIHPCDSP